jgi:hypothetical protein
MSTSNFIGDDWTIDASGDWSTPSNWYQVIPEPPPIYSETIDQPPNAGNDAFIGPNGSVAFNVTYDTTDSVHSLGGSNIATLDIVSGALFIDDGGSWNGTFDNTGGTLDAVAGWEVFGAVSLASGATDEVDSGQLSIASATLAGTLSGAGELTFLGGNSFTIEAGATVTTATWNLAVNGDGNGSSTTLDTDVTYAGDFLLADYTGNSANLYLNGHTLDLTGQATLNGYADGPGELELAGTAEIAAFTANGNPLVLVTGTVLETGSFQFTGSLDIASGGTFDFTTDDGITDYGTGTTTNEGLIEKTAGTGVSTLDGSFSNSGTIDAATGTIAFSGSGGTIYGVSVLEGAGAIDFGGGGTYTLDSTAQLSVASLEFDDGGGTVVLGGDITYGGDFVTSLFETSETLDFGGHTLDLTGTASFDVAYGQDIVSGGGVLQIGTEAQADFASVAFDGGVTLANAGTLTESYTLTFDADAGAARSLLLNEATGTIVLGSGIALTNNGTSALLDNLGTIEQAGTSPYTSDIYLTVDTTGTLIADDGTIAFHDGGTIDGTLAGTGEIDLRGGGTYTLEPTASLDVANLEVDDGGTVLLLVGNVTYGGNFGAYVFANATYFALQGHTLDLTGSATFNTPYSTDHVTGGGALAFGTAAQANIGGVAFDGGVTLDNAGTLTEGYTLTFDEDGAAGASTLLNEASGTIVLGNGTSNTLNNNGTSALLDNLGTIEQTGTSPYTSDIYLAADTAGTILADDGTIAFHDGGTIGGTLAGSGAIDLQGGAAFTLEAGLQISATAFGAAANIVLAGSVSLGGADTFSGSISGSGTLSILPQATLTLSAGIAAGDTVDFSGDGTLTIGDYQGFAATIAGFTTVTRGYGIPDTIDITNLAYDGGGSVTLDTTTDLLTLIENGETATLQFAGDYQGEVANFGSASDGTDITFTLQEGPPCYCRGTMILTDRGEVAAEDLAIGDRLINAWGAARPIVWIGRRSYAGRFLAANPSVMPVLIRQGALAENVPHRDLLVSPLHAMYLEGMLIEARALVNDASIVQIDAAAEVTYFHVELASHDVIFAEGARSETFVDDGSRSLFHNAAEFSAMYPGAAAGPAQYCAPRVAEGAAAAAVAARLAARAAVLGFRRPARATVALTKTGTVRATLPAGAAALHLVSAACRVGVDLRPLGALVTAVRVDAARLPMTGPHWRRGCHALERHDGREVRWTDGSAILTVTPAAFDRPVAIDVAVLATEAGRRVLAAA